MSANRQFRRGQLAGRYLIRWHLRATVAPTCRPLWPPVSLVPRLNCSVVPSCHGSAVPRFLGSVVPQLNELLVPWSNCSMVSSPHHFMDPSSLVPRCHRPMVPGSVVPWLTGCHWLRRTAAGGLTGLWWTRAGRWLRWARACSHAPRPPYQAPPYRALPYRALPYHALPYRALPSHTTPYHTTPNFTTPSHRTPQPDMAAAHRVLAAPVMVATVTGGLQIRALEATNTTKGRNTETG